MLPSHREPLSLRIRFVPAGLPLGMADLTDLEARLHAWLVASDFESVPWSTAKAAKAFTSKEAPVSEDDVRQALAALTRKVPQKIQIRYSDGHMHVAAEE